jgi:16S rRNA G966 N2-methylase RsmD
MTQEIKRLVNKYYYQRLYPVDLLTYKYQRSDQIVFPITSFDATYEQLETLKNEQHEQNKKPTNIINISTTTLVNILEMYYYFDKPDMINDVQTLKEIEEKYLRTYFADKIEHIERFAYTLEEFPTHVSSKQKKIILYYQAIFTKIRLIKSPFKQELLLICIEKKEHKEQNGLNSTDDMNITTIVGNFDSESESDSESYLESKLDLKLKMETSLSSFHHLDVISMKIPNYWQLIYRYIPNKLIDILKEKPLTINSLQTLNYNNFVQFCRMHSINLNKSNLRNTNFSFDQYPDIKFPLSSPIDLHPIDYDNVDMTKEGWFSITYPADASTISHIVKQAYLNLNINLNINLNENLNKKKEIIITDATSGIGGNVLTFSTFFNKVNAIELNNENYKALCHNMSLYNRSNIKFYNGDSLMLIPCIKQDIIFVDPPWGGRFYKQENFVNIKLGYLILPKLIQFLKLHAKIVAIKLPYNANLKGIYDQYKKIKIRNYVLLIFS